MARRFAILLARKSRLEQLPEVLGALENILNEKKGILPVLVESAYPLAPEERAALQAALEHAHAPKIVVLRERQAPELLAGYRLRIGWTRIDGSMQGRLIALARALGAKGRGV